MTTTATRRFAVRCRDCLTVAFIECAPFDAPGRGGSLARANPAPVCDKCEGFIETMGEVVGAVIGHRIECPKCDARCTHAKGAACDCPCGGANHGSGAVVERFVVEGKAPRLAMPSTAEAIRRAAEFRALKLDAEKLIAEIQERGGAHRWIATRIKRGLLQAKEKRTHAARLRALGESLDSARRVFVANRRGDV